MKTLIATMAALTILTAAAQADTISCHTSGNTRTCVNVDTGEIQVCTTSNGTTTCNTF
jgi:hypothetical protein